MVILHPRARADRVAVAEDVVHAADVRPEFVVVQALRRERRRFARVGAIPIVAGDLIRRVRGVLGEEPARLQILAARQPRGQRLRRPQSGLLVRGDGELPELKIRLFKFEFRGIVHPA